MRQALGALCIFTVLAALVLLRALPGDRVLFPRDPRTVAPWRYHAEPELLQALQREPANDVLTDKLVFDFPKLVYAYRVWREEGKVPLWNPHTFCGNPLLATAMPSPLYPANWLILLDPWRGFTWGAFLHFLLSGFFLYLYLRAVRLRASAALLGGVVYAFSGWYLVHYYLPSFIYAATWAPLMLLATERLLRGGPLLWLAPLAGAVALSWYGGFPQVTVLSLALTGLYAAYRFGVAALRGDWRGGAARTSLCGLTLLVGTGLAAPQVFPTWELQQASGRRHADFAALRAGALRPWGLLGLLLPDFFGNPAELTRERKGPLLPRRLGLDGPPPAEDPHHPRDWSNNYLENTAYLGLVALGLLLLAPWVRPRGLAFFWLLVAAGSLAMALTLPPTRLLFEGVPGFAIGNAKRFLFLFTLAGSVLAGLGFDGAVGVRPYRAWRRWPAGAVALLGAAAWVGPPLRPELLEGMLRQLAAQAGADPATLPPEEMARWLANTEGCLARAGAVLVAAGLLYALGRRRLPLRLLRFLFLTLAFLDLAWLGYRFNPAHRPGGLDPTPGIRFLQERTACPQPARVARFGFTSALVLPADMGMLYGLDDVHGWDVLFPARYQAYLNAIEEGVGQAHHLVRPFLEPKSLTDPRFLLLGARYLITDRDWGPDLPRGIRLAYPLRNGALDRERLAREGMVIYEQTLALPRAFLVPAVRAVAHEEEALRALARPDFDPRRTAVVEGAPPGWQGGGSFRAVPVRWRRSRELVLEVPPGPPACLVLTEAYSPGWEAYAGGRRTRIYKANVLFRALLLPARREPVEVRYRYPGYAFQRGLRLMVVAAATLGLLLVAAWMEGRLFRSAERTLSCSQAAA